MFYTSVQRHSHFFFKKKTNLINLFDVEKCTRHLYFSIKQIYWWAQMYGCTLMYNGGCTQVYEYFFKADLLVYTQMHKGAYTFKLSLKTFISLKPHKSIHEQWQN